MKNSVILNIIIKIYRLFKEFYQSSVTCRIVNNIFEGSDKYLRNSFVYKVIVGEDEGAVGKENFLFNKIEAIIQKLVQVAHNMYKKGIQGSTIVKGVKKIFFYDNNNRNPLRKIKITYRQSILNKLVQKLFAFELEE